MLRPCFLVVDREYPGTISTRKLVIETAKLNVITAYSANEALEELERFPAVNGVVIDLGVTDMPSDELVRHIKESQPRLPVIAVSSPGFEDCPEADFHLESFQPSRLLEILRGLQPKAAAEIDRRQDELSRDQSKI